MLLYLALTLWSGLDPLLAALARFPLGTHLPLVVGLVLVGWLLRAGRWHFYARALRWPVPTAESILAFLASFALTATPGKAGEVVKAGLLRSRYRVAMADTAGVLLVERLGDLLAVLILAAGGLTLLADARLRLAPFVICLILVGGLTLFLTSERLYRPLFMRLARLPRLKSFAGKCLELLDTGRTLLRPGPFIIGLGLAVLAWACEALAFQVILQGFGVTIPLLTTFSIYGVSTVIGALSMLPGGVGGVEAAMLLLLSALGVDGAAAVAPVVLIRFSTLWLVSLLGFVFMGLWWWLVERRPGTSPAN
jgi:uncharacterized membrane protein YbhN (UPF0104 family)